MTKISYMELPKNIGIVGSRSFTKHLMGKVSVAKYINTFVEKTSEDTKIISGGALGVDRWAAKFAKDHKREVIEFLPNPEIPIPARFFARNREIVNYLRDSSGALFAFIDIDSWRGTSDGVEYALKQGVSTRVFMFKQSGKYLGEVDNIEEYVYNYRRGK